MKMEVCFIEMVRKTVGILGDLLMFLFLLLKISESSWLL